jgi:signal transduction histidine kinase/ligand-binding sensor domain-containing protein
MSGTSGQGRHAAARATLAAGLLLAWCPPVLALNPALDISQYAHTAWKVSDSFARGRITCVAQTPDGYLWLGSEFGLLRFDGLKTTIWQPPGQSLVSNYVRSLLVSRDGTLWIGTLKEAASWKDGKLTQYPQLAGRITNAFLEDREGTIWIGQATPAGRLCAVRAGRVQCDGGDGRFGRWVVSLHEDKGGNLWVGSEKGVWRWKPGPPTLHRLSGRLTGLESFAADDDGALLVGTETGVRRLGEREHDAPYQVAGLPLSVTSPRLFRDRDGGLWIGADRGLMHVRHGRADMFTQSDGLSGDSINRLFEDREGDVWVTASGGLDRFRELAVSTVSVKQGLSNDVVWSAEAAADGSVWLGTRGGLNRWKNGQVTAYPNRRVQGVTSLSNGARGRLWASTTDGMSYLENDRWIPVGGVPGGQASSIVEDTTGYLWVVNDRHDLLRLSPQHEVQQIPGDRLRRNIPISRLAADLVHDGLWIGWADGSVAYFADGQIRASYTVADGLGGGRVTDLKVDPDGTLWVATTGGVSRLKEGRVATLTSKNGLPCDTVHWLMKDDAQSVWLYTACGLVHLARSELDGWAADRKKTVHTTVFDASDGVRLHSIPNSNYSPVIAKAPDGRLWFVSGEGVSIIDPRHLPFNSLPPPVSIEQITIDRKTYAAADAPVRLPPLVRDLEIDYTALSLVAPEKNRFRYKLEGFDLDWQDVGTRRQAFYNNLPPRTYRFRVIASNNSGVWNETGAALDFSIAPAYYQTAWFRTLAVVTFLSLLWSAYRIRLRVIARHQAEITALNEGLMKAQEQERTRIAGELHDGVMQQISALSLVLGTGKRQPEAEAKKTMADVQRKLIEVGTEVRQLSHDLHPPMLKEAGLPEALRGYCEEFSRVRNIPVSCHADDSVQELSRGAALALYRIAQEAMGNAVTHGVARHVDVRLARSNGLVALTVTDDGQGFNANRVGGVRGLGLINMRERARQLNGTFELTSEPGRGTTVRVTIPFRRAV